MSGFNHISGKYIDNAKIYCEQYDVDNKPALLTLHGGFRNIENFNDILPELGKEFKVIGIDSRGHGKSTLGSRELTYEMLQKEVEQVLDHLNISHLSIMGFSDGGVIAFK